MLLAFSIIHGWFLPSIAAAASLALVLAIGWRTRRWRITLLVLAAVTAGIVALARSYVEAHHLFQPSPPFSAYLFAGVTVFSVLVAIAGWRSGHWRHRLLAPVAVVLSLAMSAAFINAYYAYYPTFDSLFNDRLAHEITPVQAIGHWRHAPGRPQERPAAFGRRWVAGAPSGSAVAATRRAGRTGHATLPPPAPSPQEPSTGVLVHIPIPGAISGFRARAAWVYLPPAWFTAQRQQLPVLMLLAGTPGSPIDWFRSADAAATADRWVAAHQGRGPVMVSPDNNGSFSGDTECVDGPRGQVNTYLTVDVRSFMEQRFGVSTDGRRWGVVGLSEGGTCALDLALRHPREFHAFADFAGDAAPNVGSAAATRRALFGGSAAAQAAYDPAALMATNRYPGLHGWFEVGRSDSHLIAVNEQLSAEARSAGIDTRFQTETGGHTFWFFGSALRQSFPWLCEQLAAPPSPG